MKQAIEDYTTGVSYLETVVEGATRIDLNGEPAGIVTANDAEVAAKWLRKAKLMKQRIEAARAKP